MKRRSHRLRERSLRQSQHHTCIGERVIGEAREEAQSQVEREELETVTASHLGMEMTHLLVVCTGHTCIGERVIGEAREEAQSQVEREELETVTASHLYWRARHWRGT